MAFQYPGADKIGRQTRDVAKQMLASKLQTVEGMLVSKPASVRARPTLETQGASEGDDDFRFTRRRQPWAGRFLVKIAVHIVLSAYIYRMMRGRSGDVVFIARPVLWDRSML